MMLAPHKTQKNRGSERRCFPVGEFSLLFNPLKSIDAHARPAPHYNLRAQPSRFQPGRIKIHLPPLPASERAIENILRRALGETQLCIFGMQQDIAVRGGMLGGALKSFWLAVQRSQEQLSGSGVESFSEVGRQLKSFLRLASELQALRQHDFTGLLDEVMLAQVVHTYLRSLVGKSSLQPLALHYGGKLTQACISTIERDLFHVRSLGVRTEFELPWIVGRIRGLLTQDQKLECSDTMVGELQGWSASHTYAPTVLPRTLFVDAIVELLHTRKINEGETGNGFASPYSRHELLELLNDPEVVFFYTCKNNQLTGVSFIIPDAEHCSLIGCRETLQSLKKQGVMLSMPSYMPLLVTRMGAGERLAKNNPATMLLEAMCHASKELGIDRLAAWCRESNLAETIFRAHPYFQFAKKGCTVFHNGKKVHAHVGTILCSDIEQEIRMPAQ